MLVTPVINPVVLFSTYVAFAGNWRVVACRAGLGIVCAVLVRLTFLPHAGFCGRFGGLL